MSRYNFRNHSKSDLEECRLITYTPNKISTPERVLADVPSGWKGLETIMEDVVERFCKQRRICCEIGVELGYSTVALSNFFDLVIGVDWFKGDTHAGLTPDGVDRYHETKTRLAPYQNIELIKMSWQDFTHANERHFDLIHIDAFHDFYTTYNLAHWACQRSPVVIAHDTQWFCDVAPALDRVAKEFGRTAFNYPLFNGLGILV